MINKEDLQFKYLCYKYKILLKVLGIVIFSAVFIGIIMLGGITFPY